jgi:hypothetical protein
MGKFLFLLVTNIQLWLCLAYSQVPGDQLFDNTHIHEIKIIPLFENLPDTLTNNYIFSFNFNQTQIRSIPYAKAKLIIDGTVLDTLGIRYKGFNSWWQSVKKPIKIDLNKYNPDQGYDGIKKFNLHNGSGDPSFIRENTDYKILRSLGIEAPRTAYARVFMDTAYAGLYRIVEQVDNVFLDVNFGNHDGNLYVQQSSNSAGFQLDWRGAGPNEYSGSIALENHQKTDDWTDLIHFLDILNNSSDETFADSMVALFDVDEYLQVLAFDITVNTIDYYGNTGRNFYLYNKNGKFHWIPWDYNLSWRETTDPINIDPGNYPVLIKRILQIPEFYEVFMKKFCRMKVLFADPFINSLLEEEYAKISPDLLKDPNADYPTEAFRTGLDSAWFGIPGLLPFAAGRYQTISNTLETMKIDCSTSGTPSSPWNNMQLYPVPADDWLQIGGVPLTGIQVTIFNSLGEPVLTTRSTGERAIDVSGLASGCYAVKVQTADRIFSKMILVQH